MKRNWQFLLILMICFGTAYPIFALVEITVSGSWQETIDSGDLILGPEWMLPSTYTSSANAALVNISAKLRDNWIVSVSKIDSVWDPRMSLYIRRTGSGSGTGLISGGTSFQQLTPSGQTFFSGSNKRTGIPIQFQLTGMTLAIPPANRMTTILYTVTGS